MQHLFFGVIGTAEQSCGGLHLLNRKTIAEAFWNAELEAELRQMAWIHCPFQGAKCTCRKLIKCEHPLSIHMIFVLRNVGGEVSPFW